MRLSHSEWFEKVSNLNQDIKEIARIRHELNAGSSTITVDPRNAQRLAEACDKIQFELETTLEHYQKD